MATFTEKKYLDYNGLAKFWELIKGKFVASAEAAQTADSVVITLKDANGVALGNPVTLGAATKDQAGVMTAEQATTLADLDQVLINGVPFKGLNIAGTKVNVDDNAYANIGIALEKVDGVESIVLKDLSTGGTAISSFPVNQFVIDGLLESSDVKIVDGKPWLSLDFKLADGTTKSELIDLSGLVDVYTGGNGIEISNNVVSVKVKSGEKYLTVTADGLATTADLVTDYTKAATDAQAAAIEEAGKLADAAQTAGKAAAAQALADAKAYVDPKFQAVDTKIGAVPEGKDVVTMIGDAETAAKGYADNQIEAAIKEVVGEGGTLAGTLKAAKDYTDEKIAEVNGVIGIKEGEGAPTGLYKEIADAQAADAKAGTDAAAKALEDANLYTDGKVAEINDAETGILAQAKKYADDKDSANLTAANKHTDDAIAALVGEDGQVGKNTAAIAVLNGDAQTDGSVAKAAANALANAQSYTNTRLGDIPADTTVKAYVDGLAGNYDAAGSAQAAYDAMVRLTEDEITAIVNGTVAE